MTQPLLVIGDELLGLFEPGGTIQGSLRTADSGVVCDHTGSEPFVWEAEHLYAFPTREDHVPLEAGPSVRQAWEMRLVYISKLNDEEPRQERRREITQALSDKRDAYLVVIGNNRSQGPNGEPRPWHHIEGRADFDYVRALGSRGVAILVSGYTMP